MISRHSRRRIIQIGIAAAALPRAIAVGDGPVSISVITNRSNDSTTENTTMPSVTPFLMFTGDAEAAMKLYVDVIDNSKVDSVETYETGEAGPEGTIKVATISLNGQKVMCIDSPIKHDFDFTPSFSLYVSSEDEASTERYFEALSKDGSVLMPLAEYPFSKKFAWITDRFGVSWQLATS